ncbi:hypothetical protein M0802_004987 [Mischocyttarus mexicanus]|nr:hypothetical protein M0802_004987 [Mischocyttarus mexicanus]
MRVFGSYETESDSPSNGTNTYVSSSKLFCIHDAFTISLIYIIFLILCIGVVSSTELARYMPRGWRPSGRYFNPGHSQPHAYYRPGPSNANTYPTASSPPNKTPTTPSTSTIPTTTTTTIPITTTTERTREPTTQPNLPDETFDTNPALAIANSFAFNRPVYVYNTFPFLPGHILVK